MTSYTIDVDSAATVTAELKFAQERNVRLSIKNTDHDYIERSNGRDSLTLWIHNLNDMSFFNYSSSDYIGSVARADVDIQFFDIYRKTVNHEVRVLDEYCSSVRMIEDYVQSENHEPLAASYDMTVDNTLEFEIVTVDGRHLIASLTQNSNLYWALSDEEADTYVVILSATIKAHVDGSIVDAFFSLLNTNSDKYWAAVEAFQKHLLVLNSILDFATSWDLDNHTFDLNVVTLLDAVESNMTIAWESFLQELKELDVSLISVNTTEHFNFYDHYEHYTFSSKVYQTNNFLRRRLISLSIVQNDLTDLIDVFREIVIDFEFTTNRISAIDLNVSHERVENASGSNSVLSAWRNALYTLNVSIVFPADASFQKLETIQVKINTWQTLFTSLTLNDEAYMNETTYDDSDWKTNYFEENYDTLLKIKRKYDSSFALWQHTSVEADVYWKMTNDERLCRVF